jgi:hypothetical protein
MKKLPNDFLTIGRGAEYVVRGGDSIVLISAGRHLEITTKLLDKGTSSVVLREPSSPEVETVIFSGTAGESMQAFLELGNSLTKKKRTKTLKVLQSLAVSAASIAIVAALTVGYLETRRIASELQTVETQQDDAPVALQQTPVDPSTINPDANIEQSGLKVLKKPDFLNPPGARNPDLAVEVPANTQAAGASAASTIGDIGLPAYNPAMYSGGTLDEDIVQTADEAEATKVPTEPSTTVSVETKPEPKPEPVEKVTPPKAEEKGASTEKPTDQSKATQHEAFQKDAEAAIKRLIGNGMSDGDVRNLLMNLQQLNAGGDQGITPEMLRALPEEVAALLADQGMELDGPGSGTMNILPSEVVDGFRGKDGVATIPENYSWYARSGGPVSIPLPGGGDIKHPDDFKDFGLQP